MISSQQTDGLGTIERLKTFCKALSDFEHKVLGSNDPLYEYTSGKDREFFTYWNEEDTGFVIVFEKDLALIRGVAQASAMNLNPGERAPNIPWLQDELEFWDNPPFPGVLEDVPDEVQPLFLSSLELPGNRVPPGATFCLWRSQLDKLWHHGILAFPYERDPDGSQECLSILEGSPEVLADFFSDYYEKNIQANDVQAFFKSMGSGI